MEPITGKEIEAFRNSERKRLLRTRNRNRFLIGLSFVFWGLIACLLVWYFVYC